MINVGIIGLGRFSRYHIQSIKHLHGVNILAVCDTDADKTRKVSRALNCAGYSDWREMIERESLEVIDIITPESTHRELAMFAINQGCHVFVEKPLADNIEDAQRIVDAAEEKGKILAVGHVCRFDSRYVSIKTNLEKGKLGKLRSIYARRHNGKQFFHIYKRTHPVLILGIHDIDLARWFAAAEVEEVYGHSQYNAQGECDLVWSFLKFENGVTAVIENNWLLPEKAPAFMDSFLEIVTEKGTAMAREPDESLQFWDDEKSTQTPLSSGVDLYQRPIGPLFFQLEHFFQCVESGIPSDILSPRDALEAVRIAQAVIHSSKYGKPVRLRQGGENIAID